MKLLRGAYGYKGSSDGTECRNFYHFGNTCFKTLRNTVDSARVFTHKNYLLLTKPTNQMYRSAYLTK